MRVGNFVAVSALKNSCCLAAPSDFHLLVKHPSSTESWTSKELSRKNWDVASKRLFDLGLLAVYTNSILPKSLVNSPKFSFEIRFHYY
jgi:hypothetical protein